MYFFFRLLPIRVKNVMWRQWEMRWDIHRRRRQELHNNSER